MLRPIPDLPAGVIGFDAVGEVHADDYREVLRPAIDRAVGRGEVRLVLVYGDEFTGYSAGAAWEDAKLGFDHHAAWVRTAVVSDVDWLRHLVAVFGWMVPGEMRRFAVAERAVAIAWAAGAGDAEHGEANRAAGEEPVATEPTGPADDTAAAVELVSQPASEPATEPSPVVDPTVVVAADELFGGQSLTPTAPHQPEAPAAAPVGVAQVAPQPVAAPAVPAQWAPDPHGRHQHRWWDGQRWTAYVADDGVTTTDPYG